MKLIIHEIKLWFKDEATNPRSLKFLPNKINVITGLSNTGKTTLWSIIDYCLLSDTFNIATSISKVTSWFGLRFSIQGCEISIARQSPDDKRISSNIHFSYGNFPIVPENNVKNINQLKMILNEKFSYEEKYNPYFENNFFKKSYHFDYRDFFIFCALTETTIGVRNIYFDNIFYSKLGDIDKLNHLFDFALDMYDLDLVLANNELQKTEKKLLEVQNEIKLQNKNIKQLTDKLKNLEEKCKFHNLLSRDIDFIGITESINRIEYIINEKKDSAINSAKLKELDKLRHRKKEIQLELNEIRSFYDEYQTYQNNRVKVADSLQPIEYLFKNLDFQLIKSYQTIIFLENLSDSLIKIKESLANKKNPPIEIHNEEKQLKEELKNIEVKINILKKSIKDLPNITDEYILIGEISNELKNILSFYKSGTSINVLEKKFNILDKDKKKNLRICENAKNIKFEAIKKLNSSILDFFKKFEYISDFKNTKVEFDTKEMNLKLFASSDISSSNQIISGSQSNFMILHICFFLGLHKYLLKTKNKFVPQILFIDQPSKPYFEREDDSSKLLDVFITLNEFFDILDKDEDENFQIILLEHAGAHYWVDNNMDNFHLVDEFIGDNALIPKKLLKE